MLRFAYHSTRVRSRRLTVVLGECLRERLRGSVGAVSGLVEGRSRRLFHVVPLSIAGLLVLVNSYPPQQPVAAPTRQRREGLEVADHCHGRFPAVLEFRRCR